MKLVSEEVEKLKASLATTKKERHSKREEKAQIEQWPMTMCTMRMPLISTVASTKFYSIVRFSMSQYLTFWRMMPLLVSIRQPFLERLR